jgi:glutamyl-tRNA reductase
MNFVGYQLELTTPHAREIAVAGLRASTQHPCLVLDTCQRLEFFGVGLPAFEHLRVLQTFDSCAAFERLARIAAGLESRILGELEVIGQVRTAYKQFHETTGRSLTVLDRIFQDALALAREARRESGIDRNLTSLSGLAAHALMDQLPPEAPLAVVGSGSLASGVLRSLTKSGKRPVRIASRCPENALSLAMEVDGFALGLDELAHLFDGAAGIITATAAPHALVFPHHLDKARRPLVIVDLGVPADCTTDVQTMPGVTYISLADIESKAQLNSADRRERSGVAARLIHEGAAAWAARKKSAVTGHRSTQP